MLVRPRREDAMPTDWWHQSPGGRLAVELRNGRTHLVECAAGQDPPVLEVEGTRSARRIVAQRQSDRHRRHVRSRGCQHLRMRCSVSSGRWWPRPCDQHGGGSARATPLIVDAGHRWSLTRAPPMGCRGLGRVVDELRQSCFCECPTRRSSTMSPGTPRATFSRTVRRGPRPGGRRRSMPGGCDPLGRADPVDVHTAPRPRDNPR